MHLARNEAHAARVREERAAGLLSERFPGVASIVVTMNYKRGSLSPLRRTVNFLPHSPAYFKVSCLGEGCAKGSLDLTRVVKRMVKERDRSSKGELRCANRDPAINHAEVDYGVVITYR